MEYLFIPVVGAKSSKSNLTEAERIVEDVKQQLEKYGNNIYNKEYEAIKYSAIKQLEAIRKKIQQKYLDLPDRQIKVDVTEEPDYVKKYQLDERHIKQVKEYQQLHNVNKFNFPNVKKYPNINILTDLYYTSPNINGGNGLLKKANSITNSKSKIEQEIKQDYIELANALIEVQKLLKSVTPIKGRRPVSNENKSTNSRQKITIVEKPDSIKKVPKDEDQVILLLQNTQIKLANLKKENDKLRKQLARIDFKDSKYKELNKKYESSLEEIEVSEQEIKYYKFLIKKYQNQRDFSKQFSIDDFKDIPTIKRFLDKWGKMVLNSYKKQLNNFIELYDEYRETMSLKNNKKKKQKIKDEFDKFWKNPYNSAIKRDVVSYVDDDEDIPVNKVLKKVKERLEEEKEALFIDLYKKVYKYTGQITNTGLLSLDIGNDNTLVMIGYIVGKKGKASVKTIGAGGYNIQCFHIRTIVKPA